MRNRNTGLLYSFTLALIVVSTSAFAEESDVTAAFGKTKLGGLIQFWTLNDTQADNDANTNFRFRRAEIKLSGSVHESTRWFLQVDAAKKPTVVDADGPATADNKILQDVGMAISPFENFEFIVGQFKIPTLAEGFQSSGELLLPERSYIGRTYADRRELGVMFDYNPKPLRARLMISNGQVETGRATTNLDDVDSSKDVNGRVDYGITENIKVGVFGTNSVSSAGHSIRYGGDVEFLMGDILARLSGVFADDINTDRNGMSVEAGYMLMPTCQVVGRYENFQTTSPDSKKMASNAYTVGFNHYIEGQNLKVQLAHSSLNNMSGSNGTYKPAADKNGSLTILSAQVAF